MALTPLAVAKDWQRKGIGPQLVKEGLAALRELDAECCVVFGDPDFYQRFGFINIEQLLLSGYPSEYFMALSFGSTFPSGEVAYHPAFDVCL
jgi:putative acetyltransferase